MFISIKISRNLAFFQVHIRLECYLFANKCKNANNCWHFNIFNKKKPCSAELSMKKGFITSRPGPEVIKRFSCSMQLSMIFFSAHKC